jgi:hypothetical protein
MQLFLRARSISSAAWKLAREFEMGGGGRHKAKGVAGGGGFGGAGKHSRAIFGGDPLGGFGRGVKHAFEPRQPAFGQFGINPDVFFTERSRAHDGHFYH